MVPHLDMTVTSSSGDGAGPAFVLSLLGIGDKRGSNRGNDKRLHCSCHGDGTSPAFVVGLLDVDNKRGGNRGVVVVAGWQGGSGGGAGPAFVAGLLGVKIKDKSATGGNRCTQPVRTPGRCAIEIGVMVLVTDVQGHPEW